jgi:sporulation protein YlmC with PRC-barrel domain
MKVQSITAVSVLALMLAGAPAFAADATSEQENPGVAAPSDTDATSDLKGSLNHASAEMRETADDIKAFLMGKGASNGKLEPVLIHRDRTAHGIIGATIINPKGEKVATVKDIIMNKDGDAILVVVSDGGLLGIGDKVAAFKYDKVIAQDPDGKIVMALSQDMIDHAADFSYDPKDWAKAKVLPENSISTNELLKGNVLDNNGKKVASIDNVYFRSGEASQVIVSFDKTFGMGGDLAALDYDKLQMVQDGKDGKDINFKLSPNQTAQFKNFKKSVEN